MSTHKGNLGVFQVSTSPQSEIGVGDQTTTLLAEVSSTITNVQRGNHAGHAGNKCHLGQTEWTESLVKDGNKCKPIGEV